MKDKIICLNDDNFEKEILKIKKLLLVDFWAEWCNPCKKLSPILIEIANEFEDRLSVAKVNIESNKVIPEQYGIRSVPTLLLFRNGKLVSTKVGMISKKQLEDFINLNF